MNKQWLIKINEEDDLYYDSENKEYRLRLFCPHCHQFSGCQCYGRYDDYIYDCISGFPGLCCSYSCCLIVNSDIDTENIVKTAEDLGLCIKKLSEYTEKEAEQIITRLLDECIWEFSEDSTGTLCYK